MANFKSFYTALPQTFQYEHEQGHLANSNMAKVSQNAFCYLNNNKVTDTKITLIKTARTRTIFTMSFQNGDSFFVKAYPFHSLKQKLYRYKRYGLAEAMHLIESANRAVSVPKVYAYLEQKKMGLTTANMVIMEHLNEYTTLNVIWHKIKHDQQQLSLILQRLTPLLLQLFNAGINNIDLNMASIMLHKTQPTHDKIIDFQYATFHSSPSINLIIYQIAHLVRSFKEFKQHMPLFHQWITAILMRLNISDPSNWLTVFDSHVYNERMSRHERLLLQ